MEKANCRVCVTGAAGFIGSSLVKKLLEKGYTVHATLRNLGDLSKVELLKSFPQAVTRLILFEADMYKPNEFEQAIHGCTFVFHVATPLQHTDGSQDYTVSKTLAEKELLGYGSSEKDGGLEVVTLACGIVAGDTVLSYTPGSVNAFISQLTNNAYSYQALKYTEELIGKLPLVHINDVCAALIFCMENPSISGRFLCASSYVSAAELADCYQLHYPEFDVKEENLDGPKRDIKWGSTRLIEKGFEYKCNLKMMIDDSIRCARRTGDLQH